MPWFNGWIVRGFGRIVKRCNFATRYLNRVVIYELFLTLVQASSLTLLS